MLESGWILDLILRLAEDDAEHPRVVAEGVQHVAVVDLEVVAALVRERGPDELVRDR